MSDILREIGALALYVARKVQINFSLLTDRDFARQFAETASAMTAYDKTPHEIKSPYVVAWPLVADNDTDNAKWLKIRTASLSSREHEKHGLQESLDIIEAGYKNEPRRFSLREFWTGAEKLPPEMYPIERELRAKPDLKAQFDQTLEDMGALKGVFKNAGEKSYPFPYGLVTHDRDGNARFLLLQLTVDARRGKGVLAHNLQQAHDGYNELIKQYG